MMVGTAVAAGVVLLVLVGFWYAWPLIDRLTRQRRNASGAAQTEENRGRTHGRR